MEAGAAIGCGGDVGYRGDGALNVDGGAVYHSGQSTSVSLAGRVMPCRSSKLSFGGQNAARAA